jgi:hypothetical protein
MGRMQALLKVLLGRGDVRAVPPRRIITITIIMVHLITVLRATCDKELMKTVQEGITRQMW